MFSLMPWRREKKAEHEGAIREYPMDLLRREFGPVFARLFGRLPELWEPLMEGEPMGMAVEEKDGEVVVRIDVPGFDPKELELLLRDTTLIVRGEHREVKDGEVVRRIERMVTLPAGIDPAEVEAMCRNGVMEVRVPRMPEAMPRRIDVKS